MTIYENLLLDSIYLISPIFIYLFFVAYNKNIDRDENNLILEICLITSIYLLIKFGNSENFIKPILLINVPLLIAYFNKKYKAILIVSFFIIVYQYTELNLNIYTLIIEYITYFLLFYICEKSGSKNFSFLFLIINILVFLANFYLKISFEMLSIQIISFIIILIIVKYVLDKASKVMKYHMTVKELEEEKQIRNSLFKITHEIKNPLAVCKGYLDMFDVENVEHSRKYIPILKDEVEKTLILLQDFLSFTKIKIEKEILDINYLLEEVLNNLKPLLKDKNIELNIDILDEEVYIEGDYNRLCQVMINIIKNSIEALGKIKNPKISMKSYLKDNFIEIVILDNGCGIKEADLNNISKPFFTTKKDGTGLGVSMSLEIIKSHSGTMRYFSKNNKGTKVVINLPLNQEFNNNYVR